MCEAAYDSGGAESRASSSAGLMGGGMELSMARRGSSSRSMREGGGFFDAGAVGAGVDSKGVGVIDGIVFNRRSG